MSNYGVLFLAIKNENNKESIFIGNILGERSYKVKITVKNNAGVADKIYQVPPRNTKQGKILGFIFKG